MYTLYSKLLHVRQLSKMVMLALLFCLTAPALFAQYHLTGKVKNEQGEPAPYANVLLLNATDSSLVKGTVTDTTGYFDLYQVKAGDYMVSTQTIGYTNYYSAALSISADKNLGVIQITEQSTQLDAVVIKADKPLLEVTPNAMVVNIESSAVMKGGNVKQALEKSPGITIDQDGNISLKGKSNVLIYMDGKPTYLSAADLARLLESTSAENVEKIEIMDNPPAKYDASGNAGIINIVRKKSSDQGLNGTVSLRTGYGKYAKVNPTLTLNYRSGKMNLFGNYGYYYNKSYHSNNIYRKVPFETSEGEESLTIFDLKNKEITKYHNHNYRFGADYYLNKNNTIGVMVSGRNGGSDNFGTGGTMITGDNNYNYDGLTVTSPEERTNENSTYNFNYTHDFNDGSEFSFDADYVTWDNTSSQKNDNYYYTNDGSATDDALLVKTDMATDIDIIAIKGDYSRTIFNEYGLETGFKISDVKTDNDLKFFEQQDGVYENDGKRSNRFKYDESIYAAYMNVNKKINDQWKYTFGLRAEHTSSQGESVTLDSVVNRDYFNLFPSASISFVPSQKHTFSVSYSRRVDRPDYDDLNPFEYFIDKFTFGRGNPFLRPQYTNAFGFNYGFNNMIYLTLNYNRTTDIISDVIIQESASQIVYQTSKNLSNWHNYSANIAAPITVNDWWMANLNLTSFYNQIKAQYEEGVVDKRQFAEMVRLQNTFTLPAGFKLEVIGNYSTPMLWDIFEIKERYWVDAGLSKSIGKFNLQASLNDVFDIQRTNIDIKQGDVDATVKNRWESRAFYLNVSYRFGNDKIKQARRRGTASDDLKQRAGN